VRERAAAVALGLLAAAAASAQAPDPHAAQPERPTVATHAYTVAPGWTEVESGVEFDRSGDARAFSTPTTLKLGLAPRLQIQASAAWIDLSDGTDTQGMSDLVLSLKWHMATAVPGLGDFAIQPAIRLPTGATAVDAGATVGSLLFISSNHIGPAELDINFGVYSRINASESAPPLATLWAVSAGSALRGPLGWVLEIYGYPGTSGAAGAAPLVGLLTGPTWTVHDWFVLDLGAIFPISGPQPHALYAGLTWNIGRVWGAPATAPSR
jgi:hypothetical protein